MKPNPKSAKTDIFHNIWVKRAASLIGLFYAIYVCVLSYRSIHYKVIITKPFIFCAYLSFLSIVAAAFMIFSRKQIITKITSFIILPALLPIVILCLGSWEMIIPLAICAIVVFFANGAQEGTKTLLGTMFVLIYILAALAYFIFTSYLTSAAVKKTIETGVSPSGVYRYEVIETHDSSNGSTTVILEPNNRDIVRSSVTYKIRGCERTVYVKRPITEVKIEWKEDDLYINGERWFTPEQTKDGEWFKQNIFSTIF